jgi:hypothetical protein
VCVCVCVCVRVCLCMQKASQVWLAIQTDYLLCIYQK